MKCIIIHLMYWKNLLHYTDVINTRRLSAVEEDDILFAQSKNTGSDECGVD